MDMKRLTALVIVLLLATAAAVAAPLGTNARMVIPAQVQQIISVDYRAMRNSPAAMALKARVLPESLKEAETAFKDMGIDPDKDMEQLAFVSFRTPKQGLRSIGIAQGSMPVKRVLLGFKKRKVGTKYGDRFLYPLSTGLMMTFLDENTVLFGEPGSVKLGLDTRNGQNESVDSNSEIVDLISGTENVAVWSVLDKAGTQNMMQSALGDATKLGDYEAVRKRINGSRYTLDFANGVQFNLNVMTADSMTAGTLSAVLKAGMMYRKMGASAAEKSAIDAMSIDSDSSSLNVRFRADDREFQSLLRSDLFTAVSQ